MWGGKPHFSLNHRLYREGIFSLPLFLSVSAFVPGWQPPSAPAVLGSLSLSLPPSPWHPVCEGLVWLSLRPLSGLHRPQGITTPHCPGPSAAWKLCSKAGHESASTPTQGLWRTHPVPSDGFLSLPERGPKENHSACPPTRGSWEGERRSPPAVPGQLTDKSALGRVWAETLAGGGERQVHKTVGALGLKVTHVPQSPPQEFPKTSPLGQENATPSSSLLQMQGTQLDQRDETCIALLATSISLLPLPPPLSLPCSPFLGHEGADDNSTAHCRLGSKFNHRASSKQA